MIANGMTISDAAHRLVSEMDSYPHDMIYTLIKAKPEDWHEVTVPRIGDRVYIYNLPDGCEGSAFDRTRYGYYGNIENYIRESEIYVINTDVGIKVEIGIDDFEVERDGFLPMWGWLWSFGDSADDYWLEELGGIEKMPQCGFRIYENDEWGYFFGIDGCGYSFYEAHWIPLYKERGLQWHDPKAEQEYQMTMKGYTKGKLGVTEYWFDGDKAVEEVLK